MSIAEVYAQRARKKRFSATAGPWNGVNDAQDPGEARLTTAFDATDCVFRDPQRGAGVGSRTGIRGAYWKLGGAAASETNQYGTGGGSPNRDGQCVYDHTESDGTIRRFFFIGNKVYRWDGVTTTSGAITDVTPGGVTINPPTASPRVYCQSLSGKLIVNDGVNRPWVGTNLGTTPITGTYIDFDGAASAWTATGRPAVFGGSVVFIANVLNGVSSQDVILWSAPADPTLGYKQSGYANFWELFQTATDRIYAILGTNAAFYYWRATSIGSTTGPTLNAAKAAATLDNVSTTVGCTNAATVVLAGEDTIFFADIIGRPHRLPVGGKPEDLSWQMRRIMSSTSDAGIGSDVGGAITLDATVQASTAWACLVPEDKTVAFALWGSSNRLNSGPYDVPQVLYLFSVETGRYYGRWMPTGSVIALKNTFLDIGGVLRDSVGNKRFYMVGSDGTAMDTRQVAHMGFIYEHQLSGRYTAGTTISNLYKDGYLSGSDVQATVTTHALVPDDDETKSFDEVIVACESPFSSSSIELFYQTPSQDYGASALTASVGTHPQYEYTRGVGRAVFGIVGTGRYLRAKVQFPNLSAAQCRTVYSVRVKGARGSRDPGAP